MMKGSVFVNCVFFVVLSVDIAIEGGDHVHEAVG
jgi:hypothetical protein